jgi:uncharacterized integral membrane protein
VAQETGAKKRGKRMPWRLISFLVALAIFVIFAGLNAGNQSDISFGFYTFQKTPIFISLFVAFLLGALVVLPFSFGRRRRRSGTDSKKASEMPKSKAAPDDRSDAQSARTVAEIDSDDRITREVFDNLPQTSDKGSRGKRKRDRASRKKRQGDNPE